LNLFIEILPIQIELDHWFFNTCSRLGL